LRHAPSVEIEKHRMKKVVLLVDNKRRDLPGVALIAHHLRQRDVRPFIEPLEAYRAVLPAYRPDMIVFNHLLASHLTNYSAQLAKLGVKVAVLPNESLLYNPDVMRFNCRRYRDNVHVDLYFCWNEIQHACLVQNGYDKLGTRLEVVGNPKFDFYFEPWAKIFRPPAEKRTRWRILVCTNFALASYFEMPRVEADKLFDIWRKHIPVYERYWEAIEANHRARARLVDFLNAILWSGKFELVVRPHPGEPASFYEQWRDALDPALRHNVRLARDDAIYTVIPACDLEISCETCTTAIESWLCLKPTIELVFEKHPMFYHPQVAGLNVECHHPGDIVAEIERQLAQPGQPEFVGGRREHLRRWCHSPDGTSCEQVASAIAEVAGDARPDFSNGFGWNDRRRGLKLQALTALDLPCNFDPLLGLRHWLNPQAHRGKARSYEKTIRPADVRQAEAAIARCLADATPQPQVAAVVP
jgi:surface carbohydrate biosynthesis protein